MHDKPDDHINNESGTPPNNESPPIPDEPVIRRPNPPTYSSHRRPSTYTTNPPTSAQKDEHTRRYTPPDDDARRPRPSESTERRSRPSEDTDRRPHPSNPLNEYPRRRPRTTETTRRPRPTPLPEEPSLFLEEEPTDIPGRRTDGRRPKRRARRSKQAATFYIILIVVAVGIGMTAFAMAFPRMFDPDRETTVQATPSPSPTPTPIPVNSRNMTGLVTAVSGQNATLLNISNNISRSFTFIEDTALADRFGNAMELENLSVGHLMDIAYDPDTNQLFTLRQTITRDLMPADWRLDMENSTITVGNDVFTFTEYTLVLYQGNPFLLTDISPDDTVTLITLAGTIWLVEVAYGHGFLRFSGGESIADGRVIMDPLGQGIHRFANIDETITLPEGRYRITVEGRNIEAYITEIEIRQGETTTVDLTDVEPSQAFLELTVSPSGSRVFINNELTSAHAALEFDFGDVLAIRVERDGFYTYERSVEMNQAIVSINITLEEETPVPQTGTLTITSVPPGAQIWLNDQFVGQTPVTTELYPGRYLLVAIAQGFHDYVTYVDISTGENNRSLFMSQIVEEYIPVPTPTPPPEEDPPAEEPPQGYGDYQGTEY
ncbi:MAG: PEGA domain-containing protein [Defluviitaleaceae bacterium]|nr:PEGA domain-containing protein [Defluviitaleaceae bacterium]